MAEFKIFPEEITIENFKSIKSVTLRLKPGVVTTKRNYNGSNK